MLDVSVAAPGRATDQLHVHSFFFFSSRRRHTRFDCDWSSDVCSSDLLIPSMANQPKDRHVLAAAVRAEAEIIVTYNKKDFPAGALAPYSISAQGPSAFLNSLYDLDQEAVLQTVDEQAAAIGKPQSYLQGESIAE